ncbi:MAG: RnfABCDGE type electron transport complex subunit D [Peptococcia bacterium]
MEKTDSLLYVDSSPHIHSNNSISTAMRDVIIALIPAVLASLYYFRLQALSVIIVSVVTAIVAEYICQKLMKKEVTISDYSAAVTGLLLALTLPPGLPLGMVILGSAVAIVIGKQFFGGLGGNIFNPALIGRAVLVASFPAALTTWIVPFDTITGATPLGILKGTGNLSLLPSVWDSFIGNLGGSLGETSALALLIGAIYLLARKHIDWKIPVIYIATVFVFGVGLGFRNGGGLDFALTYILSGGLVLGAFFMATDWVTTPVTKIGRIIFALGCGLLTVLIRIKGGYPEGVCYSILIMNGFVPLIDRYTKGKVFGEGSKNG